MERAHLAAGDSVWPTPRIRDFGGWLRERHALRRLADASLPRCLGDIEERELWRIAIRDSAATADYLEPAGAARSARRARRAMAEHGISWSALAAHPTEESLALSDWNRRFERRCRELECIPADLLLVGEPPSGEPLAWIDSPSWRPVARAWLERAGARPLAPATAEPATPPRRVQAASADAELAAIARWAQAQLRQKPDFRAWICIPDLALRRAETVDAFDAALAPERFSLDHRESAAPYAVAGGTALADFAPVRAALATLEAARGLLRFEAFSALLRGAEWHPAPADEVAAARLDLRLRARGPSEAALPAWLELAARLSRDEGAPATVAVRRLGRVMQILDAVRGPQPLSRWASVWLQAWEAGPWAERQRWSSGEFQAAERLRELLAELAAGDALFGGRSAASAVRLLQRAARDTQFQSQTGVPPVWISGQAMDPWLLYDGIWIAGCGEERWPPPPDPVPLIPVPLQRDHGVLAAGADSQLALAVELQNRWRLRAPEGVFSCADAGDGRPTSLSPLLPPGTAAAELQAPPQPHWLALAAQGPRLERLVDENAPAFGAGERTRGVATLRAQSLCPFRGFAATRLDAGRLDRPAPGFSRNERGTMVHDALEFIWSELRTSERLAGLAPAQRAALLEEGAARAIRRQCARRDPGARWHRREGPRLASLLERWLEAEGLREPFEVLRLDQHAETSRHGGLDFTVRLDRMDRLMADGGHVLIDYKTGAVQADWRGERPENPQLPMYALLHPESLVAVAYGRVDAGGCGFVAEAGRDGIFKARGKRSALEGRDSFADLVALWSQRIEALAAEFAAGHAAVAPAVNACASCHLQCLCRIPSALTAAAESQ